MSTLKGVFFLSLLLLAASQSGSYAQPSSNGIKNIYSAAGISGLRKSIAFDAPLGDLLTRTGTHRVAALSQSGQETQAKNYSSLTKLGQFNSIINLANSGATSYFLKTTARHVDFEESELLRANSKRLDIGVIGMRLSKSNLIRYLGLSLISEENIGRPKFVDAYRVGNGSGLRLEGALR